MDYITARKTLEEYAARTGIAPTAPTKSINFNRDLFDKQLDFITDTTKRKALLCGRRGGKSYASAYYLIKTAYEQPKAECLYIALTLKSAKKIILPALKEIIERYKIQAELNYSDLTFTFANGSSIRILGADTERMSDRLRGLAFDLVIIDEAQAFSDHLESLVNDSLVPAIRERNGTCVLIGTPDVICAGLFYDITTNKLPAWKTWHWDLTDNKYYSKWRGKQDWRAQALKELDVVCREEGITRDSGRFKREYLGIWVEGSEQLVYRFAYSTNTFNTLPAKAFYYLLAIDYGITDESAILIGAYSFEDTKLYIIDEYKQSGLTPTEMANKVKVLWDKYNPIATVVDGNGIGAAFVAQMTSMYDLPYELAEKKDKIAFIDLLNDDFKAGKILVGNCPELIKELTAYKWSNPILKVLPETANDHCCDALLYLWRKSQHFKGKETVALPNPTVKEYSNYLLQQELERVKSDQNKMWWED